MLVIGTITRFEVKHYLAASPYSRSLTPLLEKSVNLPRQPARYKSGRIFTIPFVPVVAQPPNVAMAITPGTTCSRICHHSFPIRESKPVRLALN